MLTARGRLTIALGLVAGLLGRVLGLPELLGLATAVIVVALVALVRVRMAKGTVIVSARAMPPVVYAGEPAVLELTVEESGVSRWFSMPVVLVTDTAQGPNLRQPAKIVVQRLARGGRAQASFGLFTERRGLVDAGAYEAAISDSLGLARRRLSVSRPARCIVLPRVEPLATAVPEGLSRARADRTRPAAGRLIAGSPMLRRFAQGDDFRHVHWRTTARVGELMVRDGGDRDDPGRIATTVLLDPGDETTPADELERAVEVAASVLFAAADESSSGVSGAYRVLTTTGLDAGSQRGHDSVQNLLIALAGVTAVATPARERFNTTVARLGQPDHDEVLVIVGAFGECPPDPEVLEDLARAYSAVVLVLVGGAYAPTRHGLEAMWRLGVLTVPLPLGRSLADAWSLDLEGPGPVDTVAGWQGGLREAAR